MDFTPWSVSKADTAHACNQRFHFKYASTEKGYQVTRSDGRIGRAVHHILELMLQGTEFSAAFRGAAINNGLTRKEMYELKTFTDKIHRFMKRYADWSSRYKIEEELVERQIAIREDITECGYWDSDAYLRGVIDLGVRVRRGDATYLIVIDHKSGQPKEIDNYKNQLWAYHVMALGAYPDIAGVQAAIHWLRAEDVLEERGEQKVIEWYPMQSAETIRETMVPWLHDYLGTAQAQGEAEPVPTEGWYCNFCEYQHVCPLKT